MYTTEKVYEGAEYDLCIGCHGRRSRPPDEMGELAQRYRIMNIPTLMLFKQGQLVDKAIGARPKAALEQMLNKAL